MKDYIDKEWVTYTLTEYANNIDPRGFLSRGIKGIIRTAPTARFPSEKWVPVTERLPDDLKPVNITYINEDPAPYYEHIKGIPFTATAIYYSGGWYWWSCTCADILAECGHCNSDAMDEGIEVVAWMPLPEAYRGLNERSER